LELRVGESLLSLILTSITFASPAKNEGMLDGEGVDGDLTSGFKDATASGYLRSEKFVLEQEGAGTAAASPKETGTPAPARAIISSAFWWGADPNKCYTNNTKWPGVRRSD
jgi:hypothetical protein